tara:strand:+ start:481 stop:741 length:261 start_codon:yes stop_codon:yes gene_type:complete
MSPEKLIELRKKTESLSKDEQIQFFHIIKQNNINYTQNKNGIFIILTNLEDHLITKLYDFFNFLDDTRKTTQEIEDKIINLNKFKN